MNSLSHLVSRNNKIFFRTKGNLFFSSLAILILVGMHFIIFRSMNADSWVSICGNFPGVSVGRTQLLWLTDSLMFASILPIGAISVSLVALGIMVADREKNMINDFLVAPLGRGALLCSYLISSFFIGLLISGFFIAFFEIYFLLMYNTGFTAAQLLWVILSTVGSLIFANVFMLLIISFVKTEQSMGAVGTISGTMVGFFSGAYVPVGMFGKAVANILGLLPFLQLTVLSKQAFLYNLETATPLTRELISGDLGYAFGYQLALFEKEIPLWGVALMALGVTLIMLLLLIIRFKLLKKKD